MHSPLLWRDAIERQFRKICCVVRRQDCPSCDLRRGCLVPSLFSPELWFEGKKSIKGSAPLPWVARYPQPVDGAVDFELRLVLIGTRTIEHFPYWFVAVDRLGKVLRPGFSIETVRSETAEGHIVLYTATETSVHNRPGTVSFGQQADADTLTVEFITPARLLVKKQPIRNFDFPAFSGFLQQRIRSINYFYGSQAAETVPADTARVRLHPVDLRWSERRVYSHRQKKELPLGGFLGRIRIEGDPADFYPLLQAGSYVGVGKGTAMGLGQYRIAEACC